MDPSRRVRRDSLRRDRSPRIMICDYLLQTDHTVPYGTGPGLRAFLAMNCQATIILSLRDKDAFRPLAPSPFRTYADTGQRPTHPSPYNLTSSFFNTDSKLPKTTARVLRLSSMLGSGCWPRPILSMKCSSNGNRRSCTGSTEISS